MTTIKEASALAKSGRIIDFCINRHSPGDYTVTLTTLGDPGYMDKVSMADKYTSDLTTEEGDRMYFDSKHDAEKFLDSIFRA